MTKPGPVRLIIGIVLIVLGVVWFLQGIGAFGGSGMSGVAFWAVVGAVILVVGLLVLFRPGRRA